MQAKVRKRLDDCSSFACTIHYGDRFDTRFESIEGALSFDNRPGRRGDLEICALNEKSPISKISKLLVSGFDRGRGRGGRKIFRNFNLVLCHGRVSV